MKSLLTLIRLEKSRIDALKRDMARLEAGLAAQEQLIREAEAELERELKLASTQPEMGSFFGNFAARIRARKDEARGRILKIEAEMAALRDKIAAAFGELKKYEIARDQRLAAQKAKREKRDSDMLDEVAILAFGRKEEG